MKIVFSHRQYTIEGKIRNISYLFFFFYSLPLGKKKINCLFLSKLSQNNVRIFKKKKIGYKFPNQRVRGEGQTQVCKFPFVFLTYFVQLPYSVIVRY